MRYDSFKGFDVFERVPKAQKRSRTFFTSSKRSNLNEFARGSAVSAVFAPTGRDVSPGE